MELVELLEGPDECILEDILGILGRASQANDGRVQTILVSPDQDLRTPRSDPRGMLSRG